MICRLNHSELKLVARHLAISGMLVFDMSFGPVCWLLLWYYDDMLHGSGCTSVILNRVYVDCQLKCCRFFLKILIKNVNLLSENRGKNTHNIIKQG